MADAAHSPRVDHAAWLVEAARALGVALEPRGATALLTYLDAMLVENAQINLTAIRDPAQARVLHALDSLALGLVDMDAPARVFDLGSGNGFPGVAVHALWPDTEVVLCDRTQKKAEAIKRVLAAARWPAHIQGLGVDAAQIAGLQPEWRGIFDVVTARAVGEPKVIAAIARTLLRRDGALVLWLDAKPDQNVKETLKGFTPPILVPYELPAPAARKRLLSVQQRSS